MKALGLFLAAVAVVGACLLAGVLLATAGDVAFVYGYSL